jgi:hypothetical protein
VRALPMKPFAPRIIILSAIPVLPQLPHHLKAPNNAPRLSV